MMTKQGHGVIAHVTDHGARDPAGYRGQILHDLGHESMNRMIKAMAASAASAGVTVVGLNRTSEEIKKQFRFDLSESPEYLGRAVAARRRSGPAPPQRQAAAGRGSGQGIRFTDIDGRQPPLFDPHAPLE